MPHDIRVLGNRMVYLGREWDYRLISVALQKFIYFAHGWHMGFHGVDNRMIDERIEVWRLGPVAPEGYYAFGGLGHVKRTYADIPEKLRTELSDEEKKTCDFVMRRYNHLHPMDLVDVTHEKGSPWHNHRFDLYSEIPKEEIAEYYRELAEELNLTPDS